MREIEAKKEYLNEYKRIYFKIKSLEEQKQSLIETMESAKAIEYSDMPKGHKQTDLSDYIVKLDKIYKEIEDKQAELYSLRAEIEKLIADIPDGVESSILHKRYIEFKNWEVIGYEIGYSMTQTHRYHSIALQHFEMAHHGIE